MLENKVKSKEKLTQREQCDICKLRDKIEEAVAFCTDCTDMLCKACWQSHSFTRFTLTHKIVPLEKMEDHINGEGLSKWSSIKCESHNTEVLKYLCTDCRHLLCRECLVLGHLGHSCIPTSKAADAKRRNLMFLLYGLKERVDSLKKEETEEYLVKMNRITTAEEAELQKINNVCDSLIAAIEKERQDVLEKIKSEFKKMSQHCKCRFVSFQNIEKKMKSAISIGKLIESKSNDEELLHLEQIVHDRLVKLINMIVEPCPIEWYTLPTADYINPITINCSAEKLEFANAIFETKESKWQQDIPNVSLEDLFKAGRFNRPSCRRHNSGDFGVPLDNIVQATVQESNFVDATILSRYDSDKSEYECRNSSNGRSYISSQYYKEDDNDESVQDQKKGEKRTENTELVDTQNKLKKTSSQQLLTDNQTSLSFLNSNFQALDNNDKITQTAYYNMSSNFRNLDESNPDTLIAAGFPDGLSNNLSIMFVQPGADENVENETISLLSVNKNQPSVSESGTTSNKTLISLELKRKLDVKLDSDMYEPNLTGVYCYQYVEIVVSDIRNSKVKIFGITGQFLRCFDVKNVEKAILAFNILIYSSENTVGGRKDDQNVMNTMIFKRESKCVVSWFLNGKILVGSGNKIREYTIDQHHANFVKTKAIAIEGVSVERIVDIKCDINGHKVVVVDSNRKSVVILKIKGRIIGTYVEKENSVWNPTSACFDKRGNIFVADGGGNRLVLLSRKGRYIQEWSTSLNIDRPNFVTAFHTQPLYLAGHGRYLYVYDYAYI